MSKKHQDRKAESHRVTVEVEQSFSEMERRLREASPGVCELLEVYGGYEEAVRRSEAYLDASQPGEWPSVTDVSAQ
ncbi:MAG: hypothetical protein FJ109_02780 [Deltaproteobacteria bacterium]|nr:hypothetical protein [Deltaproteobacteria bacterium]